ncbi:ATPase AAA [Caballeronia novacaledonica]|uniref:ATPase AAA n=1 Tax=Caballeronia novacaledonica TaxID=1544861 RepID=A0A2U3I3T8_9BURK|nr:AAA family ATPase [Caballeronia novacaledonica]SPB14770.1 ATPase AAA [Caballeronia novacaledonica]
MSQKTETVQPSQMESIHALTAKRLNHTRTIDVMEELNPHPGSQGGIVLVCGPEGAGKTTLIKRMVETTLQRGLSQTNAKAGVIPAVYVLAPVSGGDGFSWKLFYHRILAQLGDKLGAHPRATNGYSLAALRTAIERCLRERQVRFLIIDEAENIVRQTRNKHQLALQFDALKSLVNQCGTQLVLVGTDDVRQLVSHSAQLARRTHVIQFEDLKDLR